MHDPTGIPPGAALRYLGTRRLIKSSRRNQWPNQSAGQVLIGRPARAVRRLCLKAYQGPRPKKGRFRPDHGAPPHGSS